MRPTATPAAVALACLAWTAPARGGEQTHDGTLVGLDDLIARIGAANLPDGAGVVVGQVEFPINGNYVPQEVFPEYAGKTFVHMSGASGVSGHANLVAYNFYGNTLSIAPGITLIHNWEVNHWAGAGFLNANTGLLPLAVPGGIKILNNSWVGTFGNATADNDMLRRADWVVLQDDVLITCGVNNDEFTNPNDGQNFQLLGHMFNGIVVGSTDGTHVHVTTSAGYDGPGRLKPEIVSPGSTVSWAIPVVSAASALMIETSRTLPGLSGNPDAERSELIKAVLLAGAAKRPSWTNAPAASGPTRGVTAQPIDATWGVDTIEVNASHQVLSAGEAPGFAAPPLPGAAQRHGWALATLGTGQSRWWRITVCGTATEVSVIATWHRKVQSPFTAGNQALANFDLLLWRVDAQGNLLTLVGDPGLGWFAGGNVVSQSAVDNIEHLFIKDLQPGAYALELRRVDALAAYPSWDAAVAWRSADPGTFADVNGDCTVNTGDFLDLLQSWGPCAAPCPAEPCPADLDGDCDVDVNDFLSLLQSWSS
jgi:hypothetical protein